MIDLENRVTDPKTDSTVDLVVLMGQTVDPDYEGDYPTYFEQAVTYLKILGIPWVSTGGYDRDTTTRSNKI